jgi:hypothetical protein
MAAKDFLNWEQLAAEQGLRDFNSMQKFKGRV